MKEFEEKDILSHFLSNTVSVEKSIYSHAIHDSDVEKSFAERMNNNEDVKLFVKLPDWFKIDTPLGNYNPDWAILYNKNGIEKLYFVIETKGSSDLSQLRLSESGKISCARKHFECLGDDIKYEVVSDYDEFENRV
jgi:type III restriction enzyme